jgi:hypothetical protein
VKAHLCRDAADWDRDGDDDTDTTPRFVPARDAYRGKAISSWLQDSRAETERWLILSARYGFIDPDQPIENYDVTFSRPATGPITVDALTAQVEHQVLWPDARPIRQFSRVIVHGGDAYFERVRLAFSGVGAQVHLNEQRSRTPRGACRASCGQGARLASWGPRFRERSNTQRRWCAGIVLGSTPNGGCRSCPPTSVTSTSAMRIGISAPGPR